MVCLILRARTQLPGARPVDLGQWSSTSGGRVFRLIEMDDPLVAYKGTYAWSDLGKVEVYPVIDTQELLVRLAEM